MKLKQILREIGDRSQLPQGAKYLVGEYKGNVKFNFLGDDYLLDIKVIIKNSGKIGLFVEFSVNKDNESYGLTNKNAAIELMSYIVGGLEEWITKYLKKYGEYSVALLRYIAKSEADEETINNNVRDKLYQKFIERFAKKHGSEITVTQQNGTNVRFDPPLTLK